MAEFKKSESITDGGASEWDESKHPRAGNGEFTRGGSAGGFKKSKDITSAQSSESDAEGLTNRPKQSIIKGHKKRLAALKGKDEGTYDLETGEPISHDSGYQVSFQQTSDTYTDDEYDAKVAEIAERTGSRAHGGVYGGDPEISFHATDLAEAMRIAEEYNQHTIFDWAAASRNDWDNAFIKNKKYNATTNKVNK